MSVVAKSKQDVLRVALVAQVPVVSLYVEKFFSNPTTYKPNNGKVAQAMPAPPLIFIQ